MVSTFTPNINLEEPARGDDVGTWDTPVNSNMTVVDLVAGAIATISLNNSPVVLSAAQYRAKQVTFNSTLTGSVAITFPTSFTKSYEIQNVCTGSSAFVITLQTTASGGQAVCCPPGETIDVFNDGANLKFKNLGRVGTYWDYAGSSVPNWVSGCSIPPYLVCDGSAFSGTTYPALATILSGTTLPDNRGRFRAGLNLAAQRITTPVTGVDGNTALSGGSSQTQTLIVGNLPPYTPSGTIAGAVLFTNSIKTWDEPAGSGRFDVTTAGGLTFAGTAQGGTSIPFSVIPPTLIGGLIMIRAG